MKRLIKQRALLARINRRLDGEIVKKCRFDSALYASLGDYYSVDISKSSVGDTHIDLYALGKELECIFDYEELESI